jgi:hypothetical protein
VDDVCAPVDNDGDGYDATVDCDDSNAAINPGAAEVCGNGIDENCDGVDDVCAPVGGSADYDIRGFRTDDSVRIGEDVTIRVYIHNEDHNNSDPGALLTIYGEQNGETISIVSGQLVFDTSEYRYTRYTFTYQSVNEGEIRWYATLTDRTDPGNILDSATGRTDVRRRWRYNRGDRHYGEDDD